MIIYSSHDCAVSPYCIYLTTRWEIEKITAIFQTLNPIPFFSKKNWLQCQWSLLASVSSTINLLEIINYSQIIWLINWFVNAFIWKLNEFYLCLCQVLFDPIVSNRFRFVVLTAMLTFILPTSSDGLWKTHIINNKREEFYSIDLVGLSQWVPFHL